MAKMLSPVSIRVQRCHLSPVHTNGQFRNLLIYSFQKNNVPDLSNKKIWEKLILKEIDVTKTLTIFPEF